MGFARLAGTRRGLVGSARALAAATLLALTGALALPATAEAQTGTTLVGNTGQAASDSIGTGAISQGFTTGSNDAGYTLTGIDIVSATSTTMSSTSTGFTAQLCPTDNDGFPTTATGCTTLTVPDTFTVPEGSFGVVVPMTAPANTLLTKETTYAVVVDKGDRKGQRWRRTNLDGEDAGEAPEWSIENWYAHCRGFGFPPCSWVEHGSSRALLIAVKGYAGAGTPVTLPTLSVDDDRTGFEDGGRVDFWAALMDADGDDVEADADVTVTWTASIESGDTAVAADLGTPTTGTVTIAMGATSTMFSVMLEDDALDEDAETFTVTLSGASANAQLAADPTAKGTIWDDDVEPSLSVADAGATEGDPAEFTVTLSAVSGRAVTVDWATSVETGDTATSDTDFTAASGTLTIRAGDETGTVTVETLEDTTVEGDETFTVTLSNATNAMISGATAKGTITDNDTADTSDATLSALTVTGGGSDLVTFVSGTTDYTAMVTNDVETLTFAPTKNDEGASVAYLDSDGNPIADADTAAGHQVPLSVGANAITVRVTAENGTTQDYTVTVTRAEALPTVTIAADHEAFTAVLDQVTFTLTRTGDTAEGLDVSVALTQDKDLIGSEHLAQTVTFRADEATATLNIHAHFFAGSTVTGETALTATVQAGSGYTVGDPASASTRIRVADPAVTASFEQAAYTFDEAAGDATVAVILRTAAGVPIPHADIFFYINYVLITGGASDKGDFEFSEDAIKFVPSDFTADGTNFIARKEVTLAIADDEVNEPDEALTLTLEKLPSTPAVVALRRPDGTACLMASRCDATVTITDNDSAVATLSALAVSGGGADLLTFSSDITTYTAMVANDVETLTFTATKSDAGASVAYLDSDGNTLDDADTTEDGFQVALAVGANAITVRVTAENGTIQDYTVTVTRAEGLPTVTVAAAAGGETVPEGTDAAFTLSRTGATAAALTVAVAVSETGSVLKDASAVPSSVTFAADAVTATLALATDDDDTDDDAGTVTVTLGTDTGYTVGEAGAATVAVSDNDVPVDFVLAVPATVAEDAGPATVTVTATTAENAPPATALAVQLARVGGTATGGTDYDAVSVTARFQVSDFAAATVDGQPRYRAEWTHDVVIHDDEEVEDDETVVLEMSPTSAFVLIHTLHGAHDAVRATLTIVDDDLPVVTIAADRDTGVVLESEGAVGFTLSRTGPTAAELTVTVEVTQQVDRDLLPDGAAAARTVTFAVDSATAALRVALEADDLAETPGDLTVEVQAGMGYTVGDPASATLTVVDADTGQPQPANLMALQGSGVGEVVLSWDAHAPGLAFTVRHQYRYKTDGDYAAWTDIPNSGQHDTDAGDGSNLTGYTVTGLVGGQVHTFQVRTFTSLSRASDPSDEATATPRSAVVSFGAESYSVDEGGTVAVTVQLDAAPGREVVVPVSAAGAGGATPPGETGADWSGVPENVTFGATDTEQTFTLAATDDTDVDAGESVALSFGTLPAGVTAGTPSEATVTIVDDDAVQDVFFVFGADRYDVEEGDSVTVTMNLSEAPGRELTLPLLRGNTTGVTDADMTVPASVTFAATATSVSFTVMAIDNDVYNGGNQRFENLDPYPLPAGVFEAMTGATSTRIYILDNENAPTLSVADASATEGDDVTFTVTLSEAATDAVTVDWATSVETDDTATSGTDFTAASDMLTFMPGDMTATFAVQTTEDTTDEDNETFTVTLSNAMNATLATDPTATGTITGDDVPMVTIAADKTSVLESDGAAGFTLSRTGSTAAALAVTVAVTQQVDRDFLPDGAEAERTVTFAVGSVTMALSVALENDDLSELLGELTVEVQAGMGYTVGAPGSATVTVLDVDTGRPQPANLMAEAGAGVGEVVLSWDAYAPGLSFRRHQYRYKTDGNYAGWTDIPNSGLNDTEAGDGSNLTGYTVTGLVGGQLHTFQVRTYNSSSSASDPSDEATATPRSAAVSFGAGSYSVDEGGTVAVTVQLDAAPGREVVVPVSAAGAGGATPPGETGADWSGVPENVTFGATDTEQTFTLAATDDTDVDAGESVALSFGTLPAGVTAGTPSEATVTIVDNDVLPTLGVANMAAARERWRDLHGDAVGGGHGPT